MGCSKVGYWFLGCSLVLIARMVGLHSYGFLNLKQQNARRTGTLIPLVTTCCLSVETHGSESSVKKCVRMIKPREKAKMRAGATVQLFAKKA